MAESEFSAILVRVETASPVGLTDCDAELVYNGLTYNPTRMSIPSLTKGDSTPAENFDLQIQNVDWAMAGAILNGDFFNKQIIIYEAVLVLIDDPYGAGKIPTVGSVVELYSGKIDGYPGVEDDNAIMGISVTANFENKKSPCLHNNKTNFPFLQKPGTKITIGTLIVTIEEGKQ